jgi:hypothetical protein
MNARTQITLDPETQRRAHAEAREAAPPSRRRIMSSPTYRLFRQAMLAEKQVAWLYDGRPRELCPVILGRSKGEEKVLAYQVGGESSKPLPRDGEWKCLWLAKVQGARLREGPWREGARHRTTQTCVEEVDLDINIHVRRRR